MSYKTENWHDKLRQVREHVQEVTTVAIDEAKSMSLDQIKKKYKRDIAKLGGNLPKYKSPLELALLRHAYDHNLIKTDNPDHADDVIDGLLDDMGESVIGESANLGSKKDAMNTWLPEGDKEAYKKFFDKALKKFGVSSPDELEGDKKKEFFNYIDKNWKADHEEVKTDIHKSYRVDGRRKNFREKMRKLGYIKGY